MCKKKTRTNNEAQLTISYIEFLFFLLYIKPFCLSQFSNTIITITIRIFSPFGIIKNKLLKGTQMFIVGTVVGAAERDGPMIYNIYSVL